MLLMVRRLAVVAASASVLMLISGSLPLSAQEPGDSRAKTAKRAFDPTRRVPMYFGQLGLTDEQKESIYAIQAKQMPKIEALEKQIEDLRAQMLRDCEATLSPAQKQLLEQRRSGGSEARSKKAAPAVKPKS
jgi:Spy/CpxP family protein refolding chaperone